ncbi:unnamed protein product [Bursaphelenchus okinawaensis]|uniref:protein-tyrosine-phosphatase n=1 Tax=Bursaphelenchus okinawaensis TaxID=465554 RepID=A0A811L8Q4_9BILA|nr:unnamed protein product [Bursaphelenchus okinawaensis]CAG9118430.1 unnamed protein product [Bursaphelenchus okinawaensis]
MSVREHSQSSEDFPTDKSSNPSNSSSIIIVKRKPGEFLHDCSPTDMSLEEFTRRFCTMNVYRVFFDYTTILQSDTKQQCFPDDKYYELSRYADVRCFEETRVKVPCKIGKETHDYIHANFVDGYREDKKFILTQAPLQATVEQFWHMIWNERVTLVTCLTIIDGVKCPRYLPVNSAEKMTQGPFTITHAGTRHIREMYDATVLFLSKENEPARKILHIAFYCWPDKGTPTRPTEILNLLEDMNYNRKLLKEEAIKANWLKEKEPSPILVHCLAGVGRSGALAAIDICSRKLDETFEKSFGPKADIRETVTKIRTQREMAVQKPEQYMLVNMAVLEYALRQRYFNNVDFIDINSFLAIEK